jgi:hypothetical protein
MKVKLGQIVENMSMRRPNWAYVKIAKDWVFAIRFTK